MKGSFLEKNSRRNNLVLASAGIIGLSLFTLSSSGIDSHLVSATQVLFQDNYCSSAGWTQIGTEITVNSSTNPCVAYYNNEMGGGGVTQERVYKQISSPLPHKWTADFAYEFTASSIPAALVFDLTSTSDDPQTLSPANRILIEHGNGLDQLFITGSGSKGVDSAPISISPNVQYYVTLARTPTHLKLGVFSDAARTIQVPGSPVSIPMLQSDFSNLNFIQHDGCTLCGSARTLTAQITNTTITTG